MNTQEALKRYIEEILTLKPIEDLTPMAKLIFRLGQEMLGYIGEEAGFIGEAERYLSCFLGLTEKEMSNLPNEEGKVIDVILEGVEWVKGKDSKWDSSLNDLGLHGDEVFYALDIVSGEKIPREAIERFKLLGIDIKDEW